MWPARAHGIQLCSLLFCSGCCSDWAECRDATWNAIRCPVPLLSSPPPLPLFFTLLLFFPTFIVVVVISAITSNECGGRLYRLQTYPGLCSSSLPLPSSSRSLYENCYLAQCRRFPAVPSVTLSLSLTVKLSRTVCQWQWSFTSFIPDFSPDQVQQLLSWPCWVLSLIRRIALIDQITCYRSHNIERLYIV